jgi:hypothetical protein
MMLHHPGLRNLHDLVLLQGRLFLGVTGLHVRIFRSTLSCRNVRWSRILLRAGKKNGIFYSLCSNLFLVSI